MNSVYFDRISVDILNYTHVIKRLFLRDYFSGKKPNINDYVEKYRIVLDVENFVEWAEKSVYKNMKNEELYRYCLQKSAQAWCKENTSDRVMDVNLAEAFAEILYDGIIGLDKEKNPWNDLVLIRRGDLEMLRQTLSETV